MNLKKHIRLKQRPRTEKEEQLYNSLLERVESNAAVVKKPFRVWKVLTPIISVAGAIAITLTCIFTLKINTDIVYNDEYIESKESTFIAMQNNINYFDLVSIETFDAEISLSYDSISNDKLYYTCKVFSDLNNFELVTVINEKFNYQFDLKDEIVKELSDYTLVYYSESSRGKPQINYRGYIKVQTETVYFDYLQIPALGDKAFFESIQEIIKVKK